MSTLPLSVIVPTYDRPDRLAACLDALGRLQPPLGGFEVIVVDDGSPSPVAPLVATFDGRVRLTTIRQANAGPAAARNAGAARARGALLAFTDDDCRPDPGWARALVEGARAHPHSLLAGATVNALPDDVFASTSQRLLEYLGDYFGPESGRAPLVASNNLAVPAQAFHAVGGFDISFPLAAGEDRDFCARWHEGGRPVQAVPGAVVRHAHPMGFREFWRQHSNYGRGAFHYHRLRPGQGLSPEPLQFYVDLVALPLRRSWSPSAWVQAGLLGVSQVANAVGYAAERWGGR